MHYASMQLHVHEFLVQHHVGTRADKTALDRTVLDLASRDQLYAGIGFDQQCACASSAEMVGTASSMTPH